ASPPWSTSWPAASWSASSAAWTDPSAAQSRSGDARRRPGGSVPSGEADRLERPGGRDPLPDELLQLLLQGGVLLVGADPEHHDRVGVRVVGRRDVDAAELPLPVRRDHDVAERAPELPLLLQPR